MMKVQINEEDIICECLCNMIEQGRMADAVGVGIRYISTLVEHIDLDSTPFDSYDDVFDNLNRQFKAHRLVVHEKLHGRQSGR